MHPVYPDISKSERDVECEFIAEQLGKYHKPGMILLDVGGIPTDKKYNTKMNNAIQSLNVDYRICDFRGGQYRGDFVRYDFGVEKFDIIIFLSSLEHFPQCTEGDMAFREGEDRRGFMKALSLLKDDGIILLTVPFGAPIWQEYHQNYNTAKIVWLISPGKIIDSYTYRLCDNEWRKTPPSEMEDVKYTDKAYGVGCFVIKKGK